MSQKNIREFLKAYNHEFRTTLLLTSHYMKDIEDLCKRTIVINQGKLVYDGEIRKINEVMNEKKTDEADLLGHRRAEGSGRYGFYQRI
ncbi:hypothetical protein ACFSQ7_34815 [Paenibacillus rhizoplanae]